MSQNKKLQRESHLKTSVNILKGLKALCYNKSLTNPISSFRPSLVKYRDQNCILKKKHSVQRYRTIWQRKHS